MVQKLYLRFGSDEFNFFFQRKWTPKLCPKDYDRIFFQVSTPASRRHVIYSPLALALHSPPPLLPIQLTGMEIYELCQELCQQASWLLIGYTRVNNQSEARSESWPISWQLHQFIHFRFSMPRTLRSTLRVISRVGQCRTKAGRAEYPAFGKENKFRLIPS